MASVTAPPQSVAPLPLHASVPSIVRIEPPHGWLELRLAEVWEYRELLFFFVWRDIKIRYAQTVIGVIWVVLQPLMTMGVFTIFFGRLAKLPSQGLPYPVFYFAALVPWAYFSQALANCTNIVVDNQNVITKVYFPRLILPLGAVCFGLLSRDGTAAASVDFVGGVHGAGRRVVDFGAQRFVPRCARGHSFRGAVLDAGIAGGVSELPGAAAVALAVRAEPYGGSD